MLPRLRRIAGGLDAPRGPLLALPCAPTLPTEKEHDDAKNQHGQAPAKIDVDAKRDAVDIGIAEQTIHSEHEPEKAKKKTDRHSNVELHLKFLPEYPVQYRGHE